MTTIETISPDAWFASRLAGIADKVLRDTSHQLLLEELAGLLGGTPYNTVLNSLLALLTRQTRYLMTSISDLSEDELVEWVRDAILAETWQPGDVILAELLLRSVLDGGLADPDTQAAFNTANQSSSTKAIALLAWLSIGLSGLQVKMYFEGCSDTMDLTIVRGGDPIRDATVY